MTGTEGGGPADRAEGTETDMGARHGEGRDAGPRPAHGDAPGMESLLAAALRTERVDAEGERRAVAAFRAALDAEPGRAARTRRRDDWRPRDGRRAGRSLKTALSVLLASLTLGGVAYAAMGGGGSAPDADGPDRTRPSMATDGASVQPVATPRPATPRAPTPGAATTPPTASAPSKPSATARETAAHCRAYERLEGRGKALEATAWQRLVAAAGGEENVEAYCTEQRAGQARPSAARETTVPSRAAEPAEPADPAGSTGPAEPAEPAEPAGSNGNADVGTERGEGASGRGQ
jgi:hypothetical protein